MYSFKKLAMLFESFILVLARLSDLTESDWHWHTSLAGRTRRCSGSSGVPDNAMLSCDIVQHQ